MAEKVKAKTEVIGISNRIEILNKGQIGIAS